MQQYAHIQSQSVWRSGSSLRGNRLFPEVKRESVAHLDLNVAKSYPELVECLVSFGFHLLTDKLHNAVLVTNEHFERVFPYGDPCYSGDGTAREVRYVVNRWARVPIPPTDKHQQISRLFKLAPAIKQDRHSCASLENFVTRSSSTLSTACRRDPSSTPGSFQSL